MPASIIIGNKCLIVQGTNYFTFKLNLLVDMFDWKLERLLWIAYLKNQDNTRCLLAQVAKVVVQHIIDFC